ncbi:hypothetical protein GJAV_G00215570, partial [Gymnothorax javanicus]
MSLHFSSLSYEEQKRIYKLFMYNFLARNETKGCVSPYESSEVWLKKNFGAFSAVASFRDFTTLNMDFNGLEVLHLLTPEQKAEMILHPEFSHLDNETLSMVFESLQRPFLSHSEHMAHKTPAPEHEDSHAEMEEEEPGFLRHLGRFFRRFAHHVRTSNLTSLKTTSLAHSVLNFTLSELALAFGREVVPTLPPFPDGPNLADWFEDVVFPLVHHFVSLNHTMFPGLAEDFSH